MEITFPANCTTDASRMAWCYRAQEKLRKFHNVMGKWFRGGITETVWNKLPNKAKARYPYKAQLTETEWRDFENVVFRTISTTITSALLANRELAKNSTYWSVDLDGDID